MASRRVQPPSQLLEDEANGDEVTMQASNFSQLSITERTGAECPSLEDESCCPVCLLKMLHPVKLPCQHVFCYLCVKGVAITSSPRCALCRHPIPPQFLLTPNLVQLKTVVVNDKERTRQDSVPLKQEVVGGQEEQSVQWFYEGRNGWWQYDRRTALEIENSFQNGDELCKFMVAGLMFTIDFERKLQYRCNDPSKRRNVRRGNNSMPIKGIAGIKISQLESGEIEPERTVSVENATVEERVPPIHPHIPVTRSHDLEMDNYDSDEIVNTVDISTFRHLYSRRERTTGIQNRYLESRPIDCDCLNFSSNISTSDVSPPSSQPPSSSFSDPSCFIIPSDSSMRHIATQRTSPGTSNDQRISSVPGSNFIPSVNNAEYTDSDGNDQQE